MLPLAPVYHTFEALPKMRELVSMGCLPLVAVGKYRLVYLRVDNMPLLLILTDEGNCVDPVPKKIGVAVTVSGVKSGVKLREVEVLRAPTDLVASVTTVLAPPIAHAIPKSPLEAEASPFERSALALLALSRESSHTPLNYRAFCSKISETHCVR